MPAWYTTLVRAGREHGCQLLAAVLRDDIGRRSKHRYRSKRCCQAPGDTKAKASWGAPGAQQHSPEAGLPSRLFLTFSRKQVAARSISTTVTLSGQPRLLQGSAASCCDLAGNCGCNPLIFLNVC